MSGSKVGITALRHEFLRLLRLFLVVSVAMAVGFGAVYFYGVHKAAVKEKAERAAVQARAEHDELASSIARLAERHNAVTNWRQSLSSRLLTDPIYSAELNAAIGEARLGHPVLLISSLRDVSAGSKPGSWKATLEAPINVHSYMRVQGVCDGNQASLLMEKPRGDRNRWAVIIAVGEVGPTREEKVFLGDGTPSV